MTSATGNMTVQIFRDGRLLGNESGKDVSMRNDSSIVPVSELRLYTLIETPQVMENMGLR